MTNLQVVALRLDHDSPNLALVASDLIARAKELDQRLIAWTSTIPNKWIPNWIWDAELIALNVQNAGLYQDYCGVHQSIWTADILNVHCSSPIKIRLVTSACLARFNDPEPEATRVNMQRTIQELADTICASVPCHLGDRTQARRIDDKAVQYPLVGNDNTPDEHYATAAAYGGMLLMKRLMELLKLGPILRAVQQQWILGQIGRIKNIYLAKPS